MLYTEGTIKVSHKGIGYVSPAKPNGERARPEESIEIDPSFLNTALSGDKVKVLVHPEVVGELRTGEVVEIIERKKLEFVGVLEQENGFFYLVPDDKRVYKDILITPNKVGSAEAGQKVLVKIIDWKDPKKDPRGEVVIVIGNPGEHETEMQAIVYESGFQPSLPSEVEKEAAEIKKTATTDLVEEIKKRRDCRDVLTFTIDPADAKDFDDALSYRKLENSQLEVGVHIADVSHYLIPGTALDKEAVKRATSIYLVDRTIPMLPEILSNDLCSLNPEEDKLTFSAIFTFDKDFKIVGEWYGRTVIHSDKRFTYEDVQKILDEVARLNLKAPQGLTLPPLTSALVTLNKIAYKLRTDKMADGAIAFETTEIKFVLDATGRPLKVIKKERSDSNLLVEDFMLLANRKVAEFVSKIVNNANQHFVYRVHDQPNIDKLKQLADFISPLGYRLKFGENGVASQSINDLLKAVEGRPEETMIQTTTMRSMAKAIYSMKNVGHYGLAFKYYTHFTSPIRRYPDVMVHRLLAYYLEKKEPPVEMLERYDDLALHSSQMEIAAQDAERDSIRYKQIEYLANRVGKVFDGIISGLAKWGIYVQEQDTLAEGMVRLVELKDDYYIFDEKNYCMAGKNTKRRFRLGDKVRLKLTRADIKERILDFVFV